MSTPPQVQSPEHVEIQLGHLCNNRCVFCVSGQLSDQGKAKQIPATQAVQRLRTARASGARRVTLLGGEPTLQKSFFDTLDAAVELGFEEIVLFTNGVMASKEKFLDRVLERGHFTWRFSLQGATREAHDAVTQRPGSYDKIVKAMENLREKGEVVTTNLCVTAANANSLPEYGDLTVGLGVRDVHLDMVRPLDAGERTQEHMEEILFPYPTLTPLLRKMFEGFPKNYPVHVGNFPFCLLPEASHRIFHDGVDTWTIAADGRAGLDEGWNKYETKRRDKGHPEVCHGCAFQNRCNGLFHSYVQLQGTEGIRAITLEELWASEELSPFFDLLMEPVLERLHAQSPPDAWKLHSEVPRDQPGLVLLHFVRPGEKTTLALTPVGEGPTASCAATEKVSVSWWGGIPKKKPNTTLESLCSWVVSHASELPHVGSIVTGCDGTTLEGMRQRMQQGLGRMQRAQKARESLASLRESNHGLGWTLREENEKGEWVEIDLLVASGEQPLQLTYRFFPWKPTDSVRQLARDMIETLR